MRTMKIKKSKFDKLLIYIKKKRKKANIDAGTNYIFSSAYASAWDEVYNYARKLK